MKRCPRCNRIYQDEELNFCLDDGELLQLYEGEEPTRSLRDNPPPTIVLDPPRVTDPIGWSAGKDIGAWQGSTQPAPAAAYGRPQFYRTSVDQTMPTISMILGILSLTTVCCFGGFYLGVPAAILGLIGMRNADRDPGRYGGRGMAIAGMVIGIITFLIGIVHLVSTILSRG